MPDSREDPLVSVIVEGYNDTLDVGCLDETIAALTRQTFPISRVEIILAGSPAQIDVWEPRYRALPFHSMQFVSAAGAHYYELKNRGARQARAPILALTDSDVMPGSEWVQTVVEGIDAGHAVVAGVSMFRAGAGRRVWQPVLDAAASISWGFIVGPTPRGPAQGFLSHNLGVRAGLFAGGGYRDDLGRTCAGSFLFEEWRRAGIRVHFEPRQIVAHAFAFRWWVTRLHRRFGHEVYRLRRIHAHQQRRWVRFLGPLEPIATFAWHVGLDAPQWWRFGRLLGHSRAARLARLPLVMALSVIARGSEAVGMYFTMISPDAARRFAEQN